MSRESSFAELNDAKANVDHIYDEPDPRAYFRELEKLDYTLPNAAKPIFRKLIAHLRRSRGDRVRVLDIGCSYGVNAAVLKHDLSMSELYEHWGQARLQEATTEELAEYDHRFFSKLEKSENIEVVGLDRAGNAVRYAEDVGLIDEGLPLDLENEPLPNGANEELAAVDLAVSTGSIGYVTDRTFERLLPAMAQTRPAWLANFVLRMFPFEPIEQTLKERGYITQKVQGQTFIQRRFVSVGERERVLEQLDQRGVDTMGKEAAGHLHAELYLSRPRNGEIELDASEMLSA